MNCQSIIANLGFDCQELGSNTLRVWSPFTYSNDGESIGLYIEKLSHGYRITDNAEALMHAAIMGMKLTDSRLDALKRASGDVDITGGVISTVVDDDGLSDGVASVLNASLAVSHFEVLWKPRVRAESFSKIVGDLLETEFGENLKREVTVTGASGHQLELPLAIIKNQSTTYIQTIATSAEDSIDWGNVYLGFGKMMDLKNAGANRVIVLDDSANDDEYPKAQTMLAMASPVVKFSNLKDWARKYA